MSINSHADLRFPNHALNTTTLTTDNPNLNSFLSNLRRSMPYIARQPRVLCPTRPRNSTRPPSTFTIWEENSNTISPDTPDTQAATAARHAKYIDSFYTSLRSLITVIEVTFIIIVLDWATEVAELGRSETYTPPDFQAFRSDVLISKRTYAVRIAALMRAAVAAAETKAGRPVEKLVLSTPERQGACMMFCRALCAGEDGDGIRSGKGDSDEAKELRDWRQGWREMLELAMGKKPQNMVMPNMDWIFLCMSEIVLEWKMTVEKMDWSSMDRWVEDELYSELALRKDYRDPEVWNW